MYHINWEKEWPVILNSNLLRVQKLDYNTPITKTLKLQIKHSLNTDKSQSSQSTTDFTNKESGTNIHKVQSSSTDFLTNEKSRKDIYNSKACNLDLLGICPSLHNNALFSLSDCNESFQSNSLSQVSDHNESHQSNSLSQVSDYKGRHQSNSLSQSAQELDSPPVIIEIKKCNNCQRQLDKCEC